MSDKFHADCYAGHLLVINTASRRIENFPQQCQIFAFSDKRLENCHFNAEEGKFVGEINVIEKID